MRQIGQIIRNLRELKKMSRQEIADLLLLSLSGYSKLERNETEITLSRAEEIAHIFNLSLTELIGFCENQPLIKRQAYHIETDNKNFETSKKLDDLITFLKLQIKEKDETISSLIQRIK